MGNPAFLRRASSTYLSKTFWRRQDWIGFVPRRSCDTNLACLLKKAWDTISSGHQTDVIYTDYSSAFQSVNHNLMLHKLENSYQISGAALNWLSSYLTNQKQSVVVNGQFSDWTPVRSGTPEVGIISLILFALLINDLPDKIQNELSSFCWRCEIVSWNCDSWGHWAFTGWFDTFGGLVLSMEASTQPSQI